MRDSVVSAGLALPRLDVGLTGAEVAARVSSGAVNVQPGGTSRTVVQIALANVLTRFNAILGGLLVVVLAVGDVRDALFGLVLIANSGVGIVQELRAKRALDRLALLGAPHVTVVRDSRHRQLQVDEVVRDDVVVLRSGDQIVVDGPVLQSAGLDVDESLLTGEPDPVPKGVGDDVLSGSFVASGTGMMLATGVGADSHAARLAAEAGRFTLARSELRSGIDQILRLVTWALIPTAGLLLYSQLRAHSSVPEALSSAVAGVVAMVPEGLVLLTSGAFAIGVVRLARRRTLVQQLPAVETLARVDVVCLDKTGTLTEGDLTVVAVERIGEAPDPASVLAAVAAADPDPNATLRAIRARFPAAPGWLVTSAVPFSSARKWAAVSFGEQGTWVIGAAEVVLSRAAHPAALSERVAELAASGHRVLLLAAAQAPAVDARMPEHLNAAALVVLSDRLRADAADTIRYFTEQGVAVKVISGDDPRTVAAVARQSAVPGADVGLDARTLSDAPAALTTALQQHSVFGRVTPQQKRQMVVALQGAGHVVAMTGDGVNDVLALKRADLGIAIGAGAPAARAVSELVLLDNSFASLPAVVAEGRRVIGNIERVAKLFVTKSVYSLLLALAVGVAGLPFPFLPRHLTLVGSLTVGVPGLVLALAPNQRRAAPAFTRRVLRAAGPAGALAAVATFGAYYLARLQFDVNLDEARTTATIVLVAVGLAILGWLVQPLDRGRRVLLAAMGAAFVLVLAVPGLRHFFALDPPPPLVVFACVGIVALSIWLLSNVPDALAWVRHRAPVGRRAVPPAAGPSAGTAPDPRSLNELLIGASDDVERRTSLRWDVRTAAVSERLERSAVVAVAALLNTRAGGVLLLGVDGGGRVSGLDGDYATLAPPTREGFRRHLRELLGGSLGPAAVSSVTVGFEDVDGRDLCVLAVTPSGEPVYVRDGRAVAFPVRVAGTTRRLPVDEAVRYARGRWGALP
jgi:cation-transporting P-type ATPase E